MFVSPLVIPGKRSDTMEIKPYKKDSEYSYALGAFVTFELIDAAPEYVEKVLVHSTFTDKEKLMRMCAGRRIPVETNDRLIAKLSDKENVFVIGVFRKFSGRLDSSRPHLVLDNPSNMGNLGTIMRTSCGMGIFDVAMIGNGADIFNPKTVRASMGSFFRIRCEKFETFEDYLKAYGSPERELYPFMLDSADFLTPGIKHGPLYSLIFGNEATGLDPTYALKGQPLKIAQTEYVDSLNLTIAVGIAEYVFTKT